MFQSIFDYLGFGQQQLTVEERLSRTSELLSNKQLAGVLFDPTTEYLFYRPRGESVERAIHVGYIRGEWDAIWSFGRKEISNVVRTSEYLQYSHIEPGSYLLLVRGNLLNQRVQVTVKENNKIRHLEFDCGEIYVSATKAFLIYIKEKDADLRVSLSQKDLVQRDLQVSLDLLSEL